MNGLLVGLIWALSMVSLLLGYALGRKSLPDIYNETPQKGSISDRLRAAMPGGTKGEVVALSEEQLAELERIQNEWKKPNDPNDGVPGYPG